MVQDIWERRKKIIIYSDNVKTMSVKFYQDRYVNSINQYKSFLWQNKSDQFEVKMTEKYNLSSLYSDMVVMMTHLVVVDGTHPDVKTVENRAVPGHNNGTIAETTLCHCKR